MRFVRTRNVRLPKWISQYATLMVYSLDILILENWSVLFLAVRTTSA